MTVLVMSAEAVALAAGFLVFFALVGLGVTELLLPKADGFGVLLAPVVGLAILAVSFQWLSELIPPPLVALIVVIAFGALSVVIGWRRRATLFMRAPDLLGAAAATLAFYLALLQFVIQRGFFTLGGLASDNIFIYVQAAQWLRDHPIPSVLQAMSPENPGSLYYVSSGVTSFPNSVGPIDAAASVLTGLPVYAVFDPLSALCVALVIGPLWFLIRQGLGGSWWTGAAAAGVLGTNQLMYWLVGSGYQQEAEALPIFLGGLVIATHAWRSEAARAGGLAGVVAGALPGVYFPVASLFAICAAVSFVVDAATGPPAHRRRLMRPVLWAVAAGAGCAAIAFYILLFRAGLSTWFSAAGNRFAAGNVSSFPPLPYLFGDLPWAHVWAQALRPLKPYEVALYPVLLLASVAMVALLLLGEVRAIVQRHAPEAALLVGGVLFVIYEVAIARYPYGYVKSIGYLAPLTSVFVAFGAVGLGSLFPSERRKQLGSTVGTVGVLTLAFVLAGSSLASRDMVQTWLAGDPTLTRDHLKLAGLATTIPAGSSVFVDYRTDDYRTLVTIAAIAYFLPDREVQIYSGPFRQGTFPHQAVRQEPCRFQYVIAPNPPQSGFTQVATYPETRVDVYEREPAITC